MHLQFLDRVEVGSGPPQAQQLWLISMGRLNTKGLAAGVFP